MNPATRPAPSHPRLVVGCPRIGAARIRDALRLELNWSAIHEPVTDMRENTPYKRRMRQVGRSRRCASMEARPSLLRRRGEIASGQKPLAMPTDCFAALAMTAPRNDDILLRFARNDAMTRLSSNAPQSTPPTQTSPQRLCRTRF